METAMDKLRILWIDDCEGYENNSCYPELTLPEDFLPYFQIVRRSSRLPSSAPTTSEFLDIFAPFFLGGDTDTLPAEIVAMDYNLSKYRAPSDHRIDLGNEDPRANVDTSSSSSATPHPAITEEQTFNFEGLVLGTFYAAMTSPHPAGVVPITSYSSLAANPVVRMMHDLYQRILKVDFSNFIVSGETRSWANVLPLGVQAFRKRVETLHGDGDIHPSFSDLMKIYNGTGDILTIRSKHATRELPVRGIFIDYDDDSWREAAKTWAEELLVGIIGEGQLDTLRRAEEIAAELWRKYSSEANDRFVKKRRRLSTLHERREELDETERKVLKDLYEFFRVLSPEKKGASCEKHTIDIRDYDLNDATLRWTSLFVLLRLLHRVVLARKSWGYLFDPSQTPPPSLQSVSEDDWMLAMFPVAKNPLVLPFATDSRSSDFASTGWGQLFSRVTGDLVLNPRHVISGYDWGTVLRTKQKKNKKTGEVTEEKVYSFGLYPSERRVLLEKALDIEGLTEEDWGTCILARRIFSGEKTQNGT